MSDIFMFYHGSNCFSRGSIPVFPRKPIATCKIPGGGGGGGGSGPPVRPLDPPMTGMPIEISKQLQIQNIGITRFFVVFFMHKLFLGPEEAL